MKRIIVLMIVLVFALSFAACKKESAAPLGGSGLPEGHPAAESGQISVPQERQIVVPEDIITKWKAVSVNIEDKATGNVVKQDIGIGNEYAIPGTNMKIKAISFLPDFIMEGAVITSRSPEPNNPAAKITVSEGDAEIFNSWIYANHPAIHPFQHEKYGITLNGGVQ